MLSLAFGHLGLHSVNTWIVENSPLLPAVGHPNFRFIGRQRQSHFIGGRPHGHLPFDLLASEHGEIEMQTQHERCARSWQRAALRHYAVRGPRVR